MSRLNYVPTIGWVDNSALSLPRLSPSWVILIVAATVSRSVLCSSGRGTGRDGWTIIRLSLKYPLNVLVLEVLQVMAPAKEVLLFAWIIVWCIILYSINIDQQTRTIIYFNPFPTDIYTISMGLSILYFEGSKVKLS